MDDVFMSIDTNKSFLSTVQLPLLELSSLQALDKPIDSSQKEKGNPTIDKVSSDVKNPDTELELLNKDLAQVIDKIINVAKNKNILAGETSALSLKPDAVVSPSSNKTDVIPDEKLAPFAHLFPPFVQLPAPSSSANKSTEPIKSVPKLPPVLASLLQPTPCITEKREPIKSVPTLPPLLASLLQPAPVPSPCIKEKNRQDPKKSLENTYDNFAESLKDLGINITQEIASPDSPDNDAEDLQESPEDFNEVLKKLSSLDVDMHVTSKTKFSLTRNLEKVAKNIAMSWKLIPLEMRRRERRRSQSPVSKQAVPSERHQRALSEESTFGDPIEKFNDPREATKKYEECVERKYNPNLSDPRKLQLGVYCRLDVTIPRPNPEDPIGRRLSLDVEEDVPFYSRIPFSTSEENQAAEKAESGQVSQDDLLKNTKYATYGEYKRAQALKRQLELQKSKASKPSAPETRKLQEVSSSVAKQGSTTYANYGEYRRAKKQQLLREQQQITFNTPASPDPEVPHEAIPIAPNKNNRSSEKPSGFDQYRKAQKARVDKPKDERIHPDAKDPDARSLDRRSRHPIDKHRSYDKRSSEQIHPNPKEKYERRESGSKSQTEESADRRRPDVKEPERNWRNTVQEQKRKDRSVEDTKAPNVKSGYPRRSTEVKPTKEESANDPFSPFCPRPSAMHQRKAGVPETKMAPPLSIQFPVKEKPFELKEASKIKIKKIPPTKKPDLISDDLVSSSSGDTLYPLKTKKTAEDESITKEDQCDSTVPVTSTTTPKIGEPEKCQQMTETDPKKKETDKVDKIRDSDEKPKEVAERIESIDSKKAELEHKITDVKERKLEPEIGSNEDNTTTSKSKSVSEILSKIRERIRMNSARVILVDIFEKEKLASKSEVFDTHRLDTLTKQYLMKINSKKEVECSTTESKDKIEGKGLVDSKSEDELPKDDHIKTIDANIISSEEKEVITSKDEELVESERKNSPKDDETVEGLEITDVEPQTIKEGAKTSNYSELLTEIGKDPVLKPQEESEVDSLPSKSLDPEFLDKVEVEKSKDDLDQEKSKEKASSVEELEGKAQNPDNPEFLEVSDSNIVGSNDKEMDSKDSGDREEVATSEEVILGAKKELNDQTGKIKKGETTESEEQKDAGISDISEVQKDSNKEKQSKDSGDDKQEDNTSVGEEDISIGVMPEEAIAHEAKVEDAEEREEEGSGDAKKKIIDKDITLGKISEAVVVAESKVEFGEEKENSGSGDAKKKVIDEVVMSEEAPEASGPEDQGVNLDSTVDKVTEETPISVRESAEISAASEGFSKKDISPDYSVEDSSSKVVVLDEKEDISLTAQDSNSGDVDGSLSKTSQITEDSKSTKEERSANEIEEKDDAREGKAKKFSLQEEHTSASAVKVLDETPAKKIKSSSHKEKHEKVSKEKRSEGSTKSQHKHKKDKRSIDDIKKLSKKEAAQKSRAIITSSSDSEKDVKASRESSKKSKVGSQKSKTIRRSSLSSSEKEVKKSKQFSKKEKAIYKSKAFIDSSDSSDSEKDVKISKKKIKEDVEKLERPGSKVGKLKKKQKGRIMSDSDDKEISKGTEEVSEKEIMTKGSELEDMPDKIDETPDVPSKKSKSKVKSKRRHDRKNRKESSSLKKVQPLDKKEEQRKLVKRKEYYSSSGTDVDIDELIQQQKELFEKELADVPAATMSAEPYPKAVDDLDSSDVPLKKDMPSKNPKKSKSKVKSKVDTPSNFDNETRKIDQGKPMQRRKCFSSSDLDMDELIQQQKELFQKKLVDVPAATMSAEPYPKAVDDLDSSDVPLKKDMPSKNPKKSKSKFKSKDDTPSNSDNETRKIDQGKPMERSKCFSSSDFNMDELIDQQKELVASRMNSPDNAKKIRGFSESSGMIPSSQDEAVDVVSFKKGKRASGMNKKSKNKSTRRKLSDVASRSETDEDMIKRSKRFSSDLDSKLSSRRSSLELPDTYEESQSNTPSGFRGVDVIRLKPCSVLIEDIFFKVKKKLKSYVLSEEVLMEETKKFVRKYNERITGVNGQSINQSKIDLEVNKKKVVGSDEGLTFSENLNVKRRKSKKVKKDKSTKRKLKKENPGSSASSRRTSISDRVSLEREIKKEEPNQPGGSQEAPEVDQQESKEGWNDVVSHLVTSCNTNISRGIIALTDEDRRSDFEAEEEAPHLDDFHFNIDEILDIIEKVDSSDRLPEAHPEPSGSSKMKRKGTDEDSIDSYSDSSIKKKSSKSSKKKNQAKRTPVKKKRREESPSESDDEFDYDINISTKTPVKNWLDECSD